MRDRFSHRFTPEISRLINDPDEYLASLAPEYLANHKAVEFAPAILESFLHRSGTVPRDCARALGDMAYEPAVNSILAALPHCTDSNTFAGMLHYLAKIRREDCHRALRDVILGLPNHYLAETAARYLLEHGDPADVPLVLKTYMIKADPTTISNHSFLLRLLEPVGASALFDDLLEYGRTDLLSAPSQVIMDTLSDYPLIQPDFARIAEAEELIKSGRRVKSE